MSDTDTDPLDDLINEVVEIKPTIDEIVAQLSRSSELYDAHKIAQAIADDLSTAESVETVADFHANIGEAKAKLVTLGEALKAAKKAAKAEDDTEALDALAEAKSGLSELRRELHSLGAE